MHQNITIPQEYIDTLHAQVGDSEQVEAILAACRRPLRKSVRVNTLKTSVDAFLERAKRHDWQLSPIPWCDTGFWIEADESVTPLGNSAEHLAGWFYIQEASSMLPVTALVRDNDQLDLVLDMASAPGSKTTQIAALMRQEGMLVANEYAASRLKVLAANIQRCGVMNSALTHFDASIFGEWMGESFNTVLLDAPCSGEGAMRKDEHAMKNWSISSTQEIAALQKQLIESAFYALKPGGTLVYSTCTLNQYENQDVCQHLLATFGDAVETVSLHDLFDGANASATPEGFLHVYPHIFDTEGFFVAKFTKKHSVALPEQQRRKAKFPFAPMNDKTQQALVKQLKQDFNLTLPNQLSAWERDKEVWLFPTAFDAIKDKVRFQRIGVKLGECHKKGVRWYHDGVVALACSSDNVTTIDLTTEQAREWYMGRDVRPEATSGKGDVIVSYQGMIIGIGKWVSNRIKNGLPRERVCDTNLFT
uniref:16S rRNA (cytosine(1407)-C(5))-methyltransferase RsmF n=1 Tax=Thaumasiovibrio occultus TaxID=1891184 RepID=UPI000B34F978|nr:16S rRNA (cytosine(1407)-C(5))-methyltransferase RsmF [Thaumasiovibrio occultus]